MMFIYIIIINSNGIPLDLLFKLFFPYYGYAKMLIWYQMNPNFYVLLSFILQLA